MFCRTILRTACFHSTSLSRLNALAWVTKITTQLPACCFPVVAFVTLHHTHTNHTYTHEKNTRTNTRNTSIALIHFQLQTKLLALYSGIFEDYYYTSFPTCFLSFAPFVHCATDCSFAICFLCLFRSLSLPNNTSTSLTIHHSHLFEFLSLASFLPLRS